MPTTKQRMDTVLRFRQGPDHETVAHVSWWFYSGLSHDTPYALMQFIDHGEARNGATPGCRRRHWSSPDLSSCQRSVHLVAPF